MGRLRARSPAEGLLPVAAGAVTLSERRYEAITSVAPLRGAAPGLALPEIGRFADAPEGRVAWAAMGVYFVLGPPVAPEGAAVVDQSDGWAVLALEGAGAADVLARLCPLDLRARAFPDGRAARSLLGHMPCLYLRIGAARFELLLPRSMARTAVHELEQAMRGVAARAGL